LCAPKGVWGPSGHAPNLVLGGRGEHHRPTVLFSGGAAIKRTVKVPLNHDRTFWCKRLHLDRVDFSSRMDIEGSEKPGVAPAPQQDLSRDSRPRMAIASETTCPMTPREYRRRYHTIRPGYKISRATHCEDYTLPGRARKFLLFWKLDRPGN